jgi:hypothetical protein
VRAEPVVVLTVLASESAPHWSGAAEAVGAAMVAAASPPSSTPAQMPTTLPRAIVLLNFMITASFNMRMDR